MHPFRSSPLFIHFTSVVHFLQMSAWFCLQEPGAGMDRELMRQIHFPPA